MKKTIWKYLTIAVVLLLILNPEMVQLAFFIDAVGLEFFFMLIEVQVVTIAVIFYHDKIKPFFSFSYLLYQNIKSHSKNLILLTPSPAFILNSLVLSYAAHLILYSF